MYKCTNIVYHFDMIEQKDFPKQIVNIENIEELRDILVENGVRVEDFGKSGAKKLEDLFRELQNKETEIVKEGDKIFRKISALSISVKHESGGKKYVLVEEKQIFADGRERKRTPLGSLSEKLRRDEDPKVAVARALQEELSINTNYTPSFVETINEIKESGSYPSLLTKYVFYRYNIDLENEDYKPEGYVEHEEGTGIKTYFVWKEMQ